ncbi:hypothetical protein ADUPG1_006455 [Aduncisulcus paluster]|uniref:Uncharacterized protein n=1 Tax=Aduncisulcus paluster TaxID=2918883 RepID=A0ABQ5KID3_9EUKA|nr:hypothetical protein ADUPG1_006455 [Aduncisulcus paluster]
MSEQSSVYHWKAQQSLLDEAREDAMKAMENRLHSVQEQTSLLKKKYDSALSTIIKHERKIVELNEIIESQKSRISISEEEHNSSISIEQAKNQQLVSKIESLRKMLDDLMSAQKDKPKKVEKDPLEGEIGSLETNEESEDFQVSEDKEDEDKDLPTLISKQMHLDIVKQREQEIDALKAKLSEERANFEAKLSSYVPISKMHSMEKSHGNRMNAMASEMSSLHMNVSHLRDALRRSREAISALTEKNKLMSTSASTSKEHAKQSDRHTMYIMNELGKAKSQVSMAEQRAETLAQNEAQLKAALAASKSALTDLEKKYSEQASGSMIFVSASKRLGERVSDLEREVEQLRKEKLLMRDAIEKNEAMCRKKDRDHHEQLLSLSQKSVRRVAEVRNGKFSSKDRSGETNGDELLAEDLLDSPSPTDVTSSLVKTGAILVKIEHLLSIGYGDTTIISPHIDMLLTLNSSHSTFFYELTSSIKRLKEQNCSLEEKVMQKDISLSEMEEKYAKVREDLTKSERRAEIMMLGACDSQRELILGASRASSSSILPLDRKEHDTPRLVPRSVHHEGLMKDMEKYSSHIKVQRSHHHSKAYSELYDSKTTSSYVPTPGKSPQAMRKDNK